MGTILIDIYFICFFIEVLDLHLLLTQLIFKLQLTLGKHRFELCVFTYTTIFFPASAPPETERLPSLHPSPHPIQCEDKNEDLYDDVFLPKE